MAIMADEEVLSQEEVESLISSMGGPAKQPGGKPRSREKITPYDFRRPERVGKEQMRALQSLHEAFSRNFSAALSAMLRTIVEVKLTSVDQLTYSEFVISLENPTCFNLVKAEPLEGHLILDINPTILFPIMNRLLGGAKDNGPPLRRPLTEIELRLVGRITTLFLAELKHAWKNVVPLTLTVERVESNPQLAQIVPPNEVVVLVSFEITLGDLRSMLSFCIPYNSIERISGKLTSNGWVTYGKSTSTPETREFITKRIDHSAVEVVVTLAETTIRTADLIGLRVGDIITTEKDKRTPLTVSVQDMPKFHASPGAFKGRKAIQIDSPMSDQ
jgi:flagellar motor switch protein FliM